MARALGVKRLVCGYVWLLPIPVAMRLIIGYLGPMFAPVEAVEIARPILPAISARMLDAATPLPLRALAAKGIAPGLKPHEALLVLALMTLDDAEPDLRTSAETTFRALPPALMEGGFNKDLDPGVIDLFASHYASRDARLMERLLGLPQISLLSVARAAMSATEAVAELIATNEERLLQEPRIIENLYLNKHTRMSTADRMIELAVRNNLELTHIPAFKEAAEAIQGELIPMADEEPSPDDIAFKAIDALAETVANELERSASVPPHDAHETDEETGKEKVRKMAVPLHAAIGNMTLSQKIRRAMVGNAAERALLVRDNNKLVSQAAVKSPAIQETEIDAFSKSRSVSEDVLKAIARDKKWISSHSIKWNLIKNPRTPFAITAKFIPHLREAELKELAKSKGIPSAVVAAAKAQLNRKK